MENAPSGKEKKETRKSTFGTKAKHCLLKCLKVIAKNNIKLEENEKIPVSFWIDIVLNIVVIVALVLIIRTFVISPFQVFGPSMCDTLNYIEGKCVKGYGEYIIIDKISYQNFFGWQVGLPKRGDVVVFHPPHNQEEYFIKRIVGLPGETVKIQNGDIYIYNDQYKEGIKLDEDYLNAANQGNTHPNSYVKDLDTFEVPKDYYFVLGDNRLFSSDSRHCFRESLADNNCGKDPLAPFLPKANIEGKAWLILWPINKIGFLQHPSY
jgi:signal peptidase I